MTASPLVIMETRDTGGRLVEGHRRARGAGRSDRAGPAQSGDAEEAFAEARAAMERGDWEGFCACLDAETLRRFAENGIGRLAPLTAAWGTRRTAEGHAEDVGCVRRKGAWYIRPLAKRPGTGRGT